MQAVTRFVQRRYPITLDSLRRRFELCPIETASFLSHEIMARQVTDREMVVTHHTSDLIPEIERVILMKEGRIAGDGSKAKLLTSAQLSRMSGAALKVVKTGQDYDVASR
ncbi:MAG: hypothetical protein HYV75_01405 [Opitutae bacterium]|nr:hypothetical protein [Opitutae bacterium]